MYRHTQKVDWVKLTLITEPNSSIKGVNAEVRAKRCKIFSYLNYKLSGRCQNYYLQTDVIFVMQKVNAQPCSDFTCRQQ